MYDQLFLQALRIRLVEERIVELYPSDTIQSPVHLSIGQEAVAVGLCQAMRRTDLLFCSYRGHAFYLAKGGDLKAMMAELFGKSTGCGGGKAGSMHLAAPEVGLMGASAVVASTIPHAVGAALAAQRRGTDQVTVAAFGDGATDEGVYHESLNFAALRRLPVLFLCENNGLAVHSPATARQVYDIVEHARVYRLPAHRVEEGYDLLAVHAACARAITEIRNGGGPQLLEIRTFRYSEHVGPGDDYEAGYRSRRDLDAWRARDPLVQDVARVEALSPVLRRDIDEAVQYAMSSPAPGPAELLTDVI